MSNRAIEISVIIPAYNAAATIVATVRSVLDQSRPPYQVIVVNDASTDLTEQLLLEHFRGCITYLKLAQNSGPAHARNAGIALARGSHIAFQDADDIWHLRKLEIIADLFERQPDIRFLFHPYTLAPVDFDVQRPDAYMALRYPFSKLLLSNPIGTPCVVIKTDDAVRFDEQMHYMEDYDLFLREGYRCGIYFLNLPLTRVNRPILSAGGQSDNRWRMRKGELQAYLHLARIHYLFIPAIPLLAALGLVKHVVKSFRPPRSNY